MHPKWQNHIHRIFVLQLHPKEEIILKADCQISEPVSKMKELEQNHLAQQLKLELNRTTEPSKMLQASWLGNAIPVFTLCTEVSLHLQLVNTIPLSG